MGRCSIESSSIITSIPLERLIVMASGGWMGVCRMANKDEDFLIPRAVLIGAGRERIRLSESLS